MSSDVHRAILITGVNRGHGEELARIFLQKGWHVIGTVREGREIASDIASHVNFERRCLDISDSESVAEFGKSIEGRAIDVLVNNAGCFDSEKNTVDDTRVIQDSDQIAKVFLTNAFGARALATALYKNLEKGEEKLVVSLTSRMGTFRAMSNQHAHHWLYGASKGALNYAMISFAREFPDIKVSLIHPGWMRTQMGGVSASFEPEESARMISELIVHHDDKIPRSALIDREGTILEEFKSERVG